MLASSATRSVCALLAPWTYILVHQTGLADTTVAEDDDLVHLSAPLSHILSCDIRTFNRIFLRDAIAELLCVEVGVDAEVGGLAMRQRWTEGGGDCRFGPRARAVWCSLSIC